MSFPRPLRTILIGLIALAALVGLLLHLAPHGHVGERSSALGTEALATERASLVSDVAAG